MSIDEVPYVVTYRALLQTHLARYLQSRVEAGSTQAVSEAECQELVAQLRDERQQWLQNGSDDEPRVHFPPFEAVARDIYTNLITQTDIADPEFVQVWILLDVLNVLADNEICEPALAFWLVEELLDSQTIEGCRKVFDYLESRREHILTKSFDAKKLVILRCCNELLRRLSRTEDTVFCGRVFIFLFQSFPLGDKSSVNLRGEFHVENVTTFDPTPQRSDDAIRPMEIDSEGPTKVASDAPTPASTAPDADGVNKTGRSTPIPKAKPDKSEPPPDLDALYPQFWALQSLFSSPTRLFDASAMTQLKEGMALTLSCFRSISNLGSTTKSTLPSSRKRKASDLNEMSFSTPFNPKYLTNRDLFDLEIQDLAFRRHILVQSLIMLDFLISLSTGAKAKATDLTNRSVIYSYTLSEDDHKWCTQTRAAIATYLQQQGSGNEGKMYYRMVDTVLSRDKNWVRWKGESCPPITRDSVDVRSYLSAQETLLKMTADANRSLVDPPGARDFDFLLQETSVESLKHPTQRYHIPSLEEYYKGIETDDLDMDFALTDQEKREIEERKQGKVWRALRASALNGKRFKLAENLDGGTNYQALIGITSNEERTDPNEANGVVEAELKKDETPANTVAVDAEPTLDIEVGTNAPVTIEDPEGPLDAPSAMLSAEADEFVPSASATPAPQPNDPATQAGPGDRAAQTQSELGTLHQAMHADVIKRDKVPDVVDTVADAGNPASAGDINNEVQEVATEFPDQA